VYLYLDNGSKMSGLRLVRRYVVQLVANDAVAASNAGLISMNPMLSGPTIRAGKSGTSFVGMRFKNEPISSVAFNNQFDWWTTGALVSGFLSES
jgi:hypothetical protein